jgi:surface polysaccharide O-acyltransferase-like enzyme
VMIIHLLYPVYSRSDFLGGASWWVATTIYSFSLVSVPLFIMLSGYLLIPKTESIGANLRRITKRLVVPLVAWFGIYLWWNGFWLLKFDAYPTNIAGMIFSGSMYHLYFLVILIGLYLILPFIRSWLKNSDELEKRYGFVLAWVAGIGIYMAIYLNIIGGAVGNLFNWWLPFLGFFLTGYFIRRSSRKFSSPKLILIFLCWWMLTLIFSFDGVWFSKMGFGWIWHPSGVFYLNTFLSPNVIMMAVVLFWLLVKNLNFAKLGSGKSQKRTKKYFFQIIKSVSSNVYAMYLVHVIVIGWVDMKYRYAIEFVEGSLWPFVITRTLLVFGLSYVLALIIRKIPKLNLIVGEK